MAAKKVAKKPKVDPFDAFHDALKSDMGDSVRKLSSDSILSSIEFSVSTGSIVIDKILAGGRETPCSMIPFGRQVEVSGLNSSGKTSLCAQIACQTQKMGGLVVITDTEERIDKDYWTMLGVDLNRVINLSATTIEDVFNKQEKCIKVHASMKSDVPMLMIWDSVGGTSSGDVLEGKGELMERAKKMYGREAKLIGTGVKALNHLIAANKVCYLYTNHIYNNMNVGYGDTKTEYGGEKLKFHATVRLRLTKIADLKVEDQFGNKQKYGQRVRIKANKNSMAPMQMEKEAVIIGGLGFSNEYTVFEIGKKAGLIKTSGSWSTATLGTDQVKFQGWSGFQEKVVTHEKYDELLAAVVAVL
ncbi:MAG: hypothetical protein L3J47_00275 [Sulfurovum sp.]|nr:hypothetical protein [Sulfurovum sp.]